ncbi:MAG TPA: aspartate--tRNA ligase [Vicinamibacterales bacterium]|jgi:aspartyl-tRNA synthetase
MTDQLTDFARTHTCGALRAGDVGADVVLLGWVHRVRDLGSLVFFDLRDRGGLTQVVIRDHDDLLASAKRLRSEFVVAVKGLVQRRSPEVVNPKLATGDIEVVARELVVLNEAKTPPFSVAEDTNVSEDLRLRYRYLDLRRPSVQANLGLRHRVALAIRNRLDARGFWEIETPILGKSTPEGARDYLVPSRVHPGEFYALPQSPQIFKQILMIAGTDRYFQIVRCFRDEDLRADRQPEFTQVDIEISFATMPLVFSIIEPLMQGIFKEIGREIQTPFRQMGYDEAMARYGSDKPDLRCGLDIQDLSTIFSASTFAVFRGAVEQGGVVRGFVVPGGARFSRRELDEIVEQAKQLGAGGLVWARRGAEGAIQSSALKAIGEEAVRAALEAASADADGLLIMSAGPAENTSRLLGQLRLTLARKQGLLKDGEFAFAWITGFPLLEWSDEDQRWFSMHHPFTAPVDEDVEHLDRDPSKLRAKAYDLVLNGSEIGGGSIRIHDSGLQSRIFSLLGIAPDEAKARFGFFLEALQYGTPPHGGIALGLDRIVALLAGESSIREVIAFPKTAQAVDLMSGAPSTVDEKQLRELHIGLRS